MSDEIIVNEAAGEEPQAATESQAAPVAAEEPRVDQAQTESVEPVEAEVAEVAPAAAETTAAADEETIAPEALEATPAVEEAATAVEEPQIDQAVIEPVDATPAEAEVAEPEPLDVGQTGGDVANEAEPANDQPAETIAQDAPESTPAVDVESSAVEPIDATAAASVAQDGPDVVEPETLQTEASEIGEGVYVGPETLEPIVQKSELESRLAAEEAKAASLLLTNEALQGQLQSTLESLTRSRDEFAQAAAAVRADAVGLVEELAAEIERFRERARALQAVSPGERVRVVLRDPAIVAGEAREAGETLAFVSLTPGVTLNFLVDAVRNRLAQGK